MSVNKHSCTYNCIVTAGRALAAHCRMAALLLGLKPLQGLLPRCAMQVCAILATGPKVSGRACALVLHPKPLPTPAWHCIATTVLRRQVPAYDTCLSDSVRRFQTK